MSKLDKNLESIFNVAPTVIDDESTELQEYIPATSDMELNNLLDIDLKEDYEKTRDSIDSLIAKGTEAIDDMLAIARESEKARDFEVVGGMIKTVVEASKELLDIQKKMRDMTGKRESASGTTNIKQAVFVGSTADLLKAMNQIKKDEQG
jgi:hypothetical protein